MMPLFRAAMNYFFMEGLKVPVSRFAMNKLVMNYLVTEGFKVRPSF